MGLRAKYCDNVLPNGRRCSSLMHEGVAIFRCPDCGHVKFLTQRELNKKIKELRVSETSSRRTPTFIGHNYHVIDDSLGVQFNLP